MRNKSRSETMRRLILLLLIVTAGVTATAQNEPVRCILRSGLELINYGSRWRSWSDASRSRYLEGFEDGHSHANMYVLELMGPQLSVDQLEHLQLQLFSPFASIDALREMMTILYSDPANAYIRFDGMVYAARDKLAGKNVEAELREWRRHEPCSFINRPQ